MRFNGQLINISYISRGVKRIINALFFLQNKGNSGKVKVDNECPSGKNYFLCLDEICVFFLEIMNLLLVE